MTTALQSSAIKLLVLVNKSFGASDIEKIVNEVKMGFSETFSMEAKVTDSASWYKAQFPKVGSWDMWIESTVRGKEYSTRRPHFDGFVVCSSLLGRANAGIVKKALEGQRAVLKWDNGAFSAVNNLIASNPKNWQSGWSVTATPLE